MTITLYPAIDLKDGKCVRLLRGEMDKATVFSNSPADQAEAFEQSGFEWLHIVDLNGAFEGKPVNESAVKSILERVKMPVQLGGGIRDITMIAGWLEAGISRVILGTVADIRNLLLAGADKVSINTQAVKHPEFVGEAAEKFGSQCIVVAIDAKQVAPGKFEIFTHGGRERTGIDAVAWAQKMAELGAGEILLTSMDRDGTKQGINLALTKAVAEAVPIPVIASGGIGTLEHFVEAVQGGKADAVLAASVFHFGTYSIAQVKEIMNNAHIPVRM